MSVDYRLRRRTASRGVRRRGHGGAVAAAAGGDLQRGRRALLVARPLPLRPRIPRGDSAGATIAFHVAARLGHGQLGALTPLDVKGAILIQPFFGGETRTASEKTMPQPPGSALTLSTSDTYWRMSLPAGATRDHPWCNPVTGRGAPRLDSLPLPDFLVCISEQDILRDRNLELCSALRRAGHSVEQATYGGVGHAFQVLNNYHLSQPRTQEMLAHIKAFVRAR